jgi:hypothetical protein
MNEKIAELTERIRRLELELEHEFARRRVQFAYTVHDHRVHFHEHILRRHRELKKQWLTYLLGARPLMIATAPFIYAVILPFVLLDVMVSVYQRICFPAYGIALVRRSEYMIFDRGQLAYLNAIEKLNCMYCSYANGVIGYVREIAARTEQYWCPIKHARRVLGTHERYSKFCDYGDVEAFQAESTVLRKELNAQAAADSASANP